MKLLNIIAEQFPDYLKKSKKSRAKAVHFKCLDCQGGSAKLVRKCLITTCPLWAWRSQRATRELKREEAQP